LRSGQFLQLGNHRPPTDDAGGEAVKETLSVFFRIGPDASRLCVKGRDAWALLELHRAGKRGVTPIDTPGPRWSGYVFNLRRIGVNIETVHESHGGPFAGTHARCILRSEVSILEREADGKAA
jgi:hypothetical protein